MEFNTLKEVIHFAIGQEEAAYNLYRQAADQSVNISARKMFLDMAEEEAAHKRMLEGFTRQRLEQYPFRPVQDLKIGDYLVDVPCTPDMTYQQVLIFAMKAEERAARLYTEAASQVGDPETRKLLLIMANEEKKHKFHLEALYDDKVLTED
jgi:rubrerythrin